MKDYYKTLEVDPQASTEVIHKAYRALVQKYHPDRFHSSARANPQKAILEKMQAINEAYETLSDERRRRSYDRQFQREAPTGSARLNIDPKRMGLWALGTIFVLAFASTGLKALLMLPIGRFLLVGLVLAIVFFGPRLYRQLAENLKE